MRFSMITLIAGAAAVNAAALPQQENCGGWGQPACCGGYGQPACYYPSNENPYVKRGSPVEDLVDYTKDPYAKDSYSSDPYSSESYGKDSYPYDPYSEDSYGKDTYGSDPYGSDPYGKAPYYPSGNPDCGDGKTGYHCSSSGLINALNCVNILSKRDSFTVKRSLKDSAMNLFGRGADGGDYCCSSSGAINALNCVNILSKRSFTAEKSYQM